MNDRDDQFPAKSVRRKHDPRSHARDLYRHRPPPKRQRTDEYDHGDIGEQRRAVIDSAVGDNNDTNATSTSIDLTDDATETTSVTTTVSVSPTPIPDLVLPKQFTTLPPRVAINPANNIPEDDGFGSGTEGSSSLTTTGVAEITTTSSIINITATETSSATELPNFVPPIVPPITSAIESIATSVLNVTGFPDLPMPSLPSSLLGDISSLSVSLTANLTLPTPLVPFPTLPSDSTLLAGSTIITPIPIPWTTALASTSSAGIGPIANVTSNSVPTTFTTSLPTGPGLPPNVSITSTSSIGQTSTESATLSPTIPFQNSTSVTNGPTIPTASPPIGQSNTTGLSSSQSFTFGTVGSSTSPNLTLSTFQTITTATPLFNTTSGLLSPSQASATSSASLSLNSTASQLSATSALSSISAFSSTSSFLGAPFFTPGATPLGGPGAAPTPTATPATPHQNSTNVVPLVPAIVGSIGGIALLAALGVILFTLRRRRTISRIPSSARAPMSGRGFQVVSGQRLDTGISGATPVVFREPGRPGPRSQAAISRRATTASRFTEHL